MMWGGGLEMVSEEVVERLAESMVSHRRHLHRHPEVGIDLPDTHRYLVTQLEKMGYHPEHHPSSGVSVTIPGTNPGAPALVFRADMDALPVVEDTGLEFASQRLGAMHACGHDLHMATLLGVAKYFTAHTPTRTLVLAFQPGEESDRGALRTLTHNNLQIYPAETFAVHVNAVMEAGSIQISHGTFMAYGDWFSVCLRGPGGHASAPERAGSPIRAGAQIAEAFVEHAKALSTPQARVVATVTEFLAGNTVNVIPAVATLRGTLRTLDADTRTTLHGLMEKSVSQLAERNDLTGTFTLHEGYPAVENNPEFMQQALEVFERAGIGPIIEMDHPSMVIEDFSYFLHKWPGAMVYVGAAVGNKPAFNHSAHAVFDESAMGVAARLFIALATTPAP